MSTEFAAPVSIITTIVVVIFLIIASQTKTEQTKVNAIAVLIVGVTVLGFVFFVVRFHRDDVNNYGKQNPYCIREICTNTTSTDPDTAYAGINQDPQQVYFNTAYYCIGNAPTVGLTGPDAPNFWNSMINCSVASSQNDSDWQYFHNPFSGSIQNEYNLSSDLVINIYADWYVNRYLPLCGNQWNGTTNPSGSTPPIPANDYFWPTINACQQHIPPS